MAYIIYHTTHGPMAYMDGPAYAARANEGEIIIPCEPGADVNDTARWAAEAALVQQSSTPAFLAREKKLGAILAGANAVKAALSSRFSALEESTWPQQEAGARAILDTQAACKNLMALLILSNTTATAVAMALVDQLAATDGVDRNAFAARICANAELADQLGTLSLLEQRGMESAVNTAYAADDIAGIDAVAVRYTVLQPPRQQGEGT